MIHKVNEVIEILKEMELHELRALIDVLKQLHDAAALSSKPGSLKARGIKNDT